jgi:hypothetical protein
MPDRHEESALQLIAVSVSLQAVVELGRPFGFCLNGKKRFFLIFFHQGLIFFSVKVK